MVGEGGRHTRTTFIDGSTHKLSTEAKAHQWAEGTHRNPCMLPNLNPKCNGVIHSALAQLPSRACAHLPKKDMCSLMLVLNDGGRHTRIN